MADETELTAAFDEALGQVERAIASDMRTRSGGAARPQLERLREQLLAERAAAAARRAVDRAWVGAAVRSVADWAPDHELKLIAALGAIARGGGRG